MSATPGGENDIYGTIVGKKKRHYTMPKKFHQMAFVHWDAGQRVV